MRRIPFLLAFILAFAASSLAQKQVDEYSGTIYVPFGYARQVDGTMKPTRGLLLPYVARRIHATPIKDVKPVIAEGGEDATTVYSADAGSGYGYIEDPDPSSIDDNVMVNGANLPWKELTFGINADESRMILIRWIVFTNYVTGRGDNVSAFDPYVDSQHQGIADFGGFFNAQQGVWKVTVNIAAAGCTSPQNSIYLAQQFRELDPNGEGAFLLGMRNVYNAGAGPTLGTSENVFWYDWSDLNGIYSENEIDNFGNQSFANHLRTIVVEGTQDTLMPFQFNLAQGSYVSGELVDFWQSDDSYYRARPVYNVPRNTPPLQIEVEALSPSATILSLKFTFEGSGDSGGGEQIIQLFNYSTNQYDTVDTRPITATDSTVDVFITTNPSRYVNPSNRRMKSKILYFPPGDASRTWAAKIDRTNWVVTRP